MGYSLSSWLLYLILRLDKNHFDQSQDHIIKGLLSLSTFKILNSSIGGFVVYDITKKESFTNIEKWISETQNYAN